jgi:hypothetical protein
VKVIQPWLGSAHEVIIPSRFLRILKIMTSLYLLWMGGRCGKKNVGSTVPSVILSKGQRMKNGLMDYLPYL